MNTSILKVPIVAWLFTVFLCYSNVVFSGDTHTLIPGLVGDALKVEQESPSGNNVDSVAFTSDLSLWYALQETDELENNSSSFFDIFIDPALINPNLGLIDFGTTKKTGDIPLKFNQENKQKYSVYSNDPNRWFDIPAVMNTLTALSAALKGVAGVKLPTKGIPTAIEKLHGVAEKYKEVKKNLKLTFALLELFSSIVCDIDDFRHDGKLDGNTSHSCWELKTRIKSVLNAIDGSLDSLSEPQDFDNSQAEEIRELITLIISTIKDSDKKLSQIKGELWESIRKIATKSATGVMPVWLIETGITTCLTGGQNTFKKADNKVEWSTRSIARYTVAQFCEGRDGRVASLFCKNPGSSKYSRFYQSEYANSDELWQKYQSGYKSYREYLKAGWQSLIMNQFVTLSQNTTSPRNCLIGQIKRWDEFSEVAVKLAKLNDIIVKLIGKSSQVDKEQLLIFVKLLGSEIWSFTSKELRTLALDFMKSLTPARFLKMASAANTDSGMAWDAVTKPSRVDFKVTKGNNNEFSFATALPPLDHIRYLAIPIECVKPEIVKDSKGDDKNICHAYYNGDDYILDVVKNSSVGIDYFPAALDWWVEDISSDEYTYTGAYTLSTDLQNNHFLLMRGAKLSVENKAGVRDDSGMISQVKSFFKTLDDDNFKVDWHSYRYMDSSELPMKLERTESTNFGGDVDIETKVSDFDCPPGDWNWCNDDDKYYEEYFNKKDGRWSNPVLEAYMDAPKQMVPPKPVLTKLNLIDFGRIYLTKHKGGLEHLTPGIYLDSTKIVLGDAEYTSAFHAYVMIDYDAYTNNEGGESHRSILLKQSQRVVDNNNNLIGLNLQLQREYFNFWGITTSFPDRVNVDEHPFHVFIKVDEQWAGPIEINLGDGKQHYVPLPSRVGTNVSSIFIYDTVLHNYIQATGRTVRELLTEPKLMYRKEEGKDARPFILFQPSEVNDVVMTSTNNVDADGDNVPDLFDLWKYNDRYVFDSDNDGIADAWEKANGLNPLKFEDGAEYLQQFQDDLNKIEDIISEPPKFPINQDVKFRLPLSDTSGISVSSYFAHNSANDECSGLKDWDNSSKTYSGHKGTDFAAVKGTVVVTAAHGTVVKIVDGKKDDCAIVLGAANIEPCKDYGNYIDIEHSDGKKTRYAHLKNGSFLVEEEQEVQCGEAIAQVGSSGYSTNPHLHFQVNLAGGTADDPFQGKCSGPLSYWVDQGEYLGLPSTACQSADASNTPDEPPPPITVRTIEENGDIQISGTDLGTAGTITVDGKAVQGQWTADGITLNMGALENLDKPMQIKLVNDNGNEFNLCYPFVDVCPNSWYARPVITLWKKGIINGYGGDWEGYFRPHKPPASRAELVAATVRAKELGNTPAPLTSSPFADVSIDDWYAVYVEYAKETGLVQGCDTDKNLFCPNAPISRAGGVKVVASAFLNDTLVQFQNGKQPPRLFLDVTEPDDWFYPYVYAAEIENVVDGYSDGNFKPGQNLTRAEMAKMVCIAAFGAMECTEMGETNRPFIFAVTPEIATLNETTLFTVVGRNLSDAITFELPDCINITPIAGGTAEDILFQCTPSNTSGVKNGTLRYNEGHTVFTVNVVEQVVPEVTSVLPETATLNQLTIFTVEGSNLPETLAFWIANCDGVTAISRTPTQQQFQCTPTNGATGSQEGVVKDESGANKLKVFVVDVVAPVSEPPIEPPPVVEPPVVEPPVVEPPVVEPPVVEPPVVESPDTSCTTPVVNSVKPTTVTISESVIFTAYGECLPDTTAFWIGECEGMTALGGSDTEQKFRCTPSWTVGSKDAHIKNESGGDFLKPPFTVDVEWGSTPVVTSVTPSSADLDSPTDFVIKGKSLTDDIAFWIGECENVEVVNRNAEEQIFRCTPSWTPGTKDGVVKDQPGGTELDSFTVNVQ